MVAVEVISVWGLGEEELYVEADQMRLESELLLVLSVNLHGGCTDLREGRVEVSRDTEITLVCGSFFLLT